MIFCRLPSHAQQTLCSSSPCASPCAVPTCEADRCAVWGLSQTATGLHVRFQTSATQVHVRWSMIPENGDWLWALGGHSGVDFYVQDDTTNGAWRWGVASGNNPGAVGGSMAAAALAQTTRYKNFTATLGVMASGRVRNVTLYLPSRGTVASVAVGVAPTDTVTPLPMDATPKPVTVYGTSILHGAAAGRPGMVYSSQMERYIGMPVVNLGFSGHGLMQQEVSALLSEVESSLYVLDCEVRLRLSPLSRPLTCHGTLLTHCESRPSSLSPTVSFLHTQRFIHTLTLTLTCCPPIPARTCPALSP